MKKPASLSFQTTLFNGLFMLFTFSLTYLVLDSYLRQTARRRLDQELETRLMLLISEMDQNFPEATLADWSNMLQQFGSIYGIPQSLFQLLDQTGEAVASSDPAYWPDFQPRFGTLDIHTLRWRNVTVEGRRARMLLYRLDEVQTLVVAMDKAPYQQPQQQTRHIFWFGSLAALALSMLFIWYNTRRGFSGVRAVVGKARLIRDQDSLDHRVAMPTGYRETDELASTFNQMLDHIDDLMTGLKQMMDHAAHDLKTPVTLIRGLAEREVRQQPERADHAAKIIGECDRMMVLLTSLLDITATESGLYSWQWQTVDLVALVAEGCELFEPVAAQKSLMIQAELPARLRFITDAAVFQRVVSNLIDNAVKYSQAGKIVVRLTETLTGLCLEVEDRGQGVAARERELIFQRFYRGQGERTNDGNGLGLSYCRAAVQGLGGTITCESRTDGGTRFRVILARRKGT